MRFKLVMLSIAGFLFTLHGGNAMDPSREIYEAVLDAPISRVWQAFTTEELLRKWMAPVIELDWKVGGTIRTNYNPEGTIGDGTTIENTILSYDPERMLSIKATGFPDNFPFKDAAETTWSVFYFDAVTPDKTKLTIVGLGYGPDEQSRAMRQYFASANASLVTKLNEVLAAASSRE